MGHHPQTRKLCLLHRQLCAVLLILPYLCYLVLCEHVGDCGQGIRVRTETCEDEVGRRQGYVDLVLPFPFVADTGGTYYGGGACV